jgi:hypothetical protein
MLRPHSPVCRVGAQVSVGRIDVGVAVEEARYERDAATGVRGEWATVGVGGAAVVESCHCACGCGRAVRFKSPFALRGTLATAMKASGYLFNVRRVATTGKWFAQIKLRGVNVHTRYHKHAWQAAADLEWQLARWCAHTGQLRSHLVSNAARLVDLGRADAAGVLMAAVEVTPWMLSRWRGSSAHRLSARAAARRGARDIAPAPAVGAGGPAAAAEAPQPHITVELEHLTRQEQRLVAPWLTDDLLDAMGCRRDDEPPSPEVAAYVAILRAERVMRGVEQAVAAAAAAAAAGGVGDGGTGGDVAAADAAAAEEAPAAVAAVADAGAGAGGGAWGGAIGLAIADAAAAEASGGVWQDAWDALLSTPAVVVPPEPVPAAAAPAATVGSKRRRGSGAASSEAAAARAGAGGRRRVEEGGYGGCGW